jgi:ribosomal protein S11
LQLASLTVAGLLTVTPASGQSLYTFTTIAGQPGGDSFSYPAGMAVDLHGNLYVLDTGNNTIRQLTPIGTNWVVTTIAGQTGVRGSADGVGTNALFGFYSGGGGGMAIDTQTNLYVTDSFNNTIRKITPTGTNWVVTTIAGLRGLIVSNNPYASRGSADGIGTNAGFSYPFGIAADAGANVYVADTGNGTIRKITPTGTNWVVTTIAGQAGVNGYTDGVGTNALFWIGLGGITVDAHTNLYVADSDGAAIRKITPVGSLWVVTTIAGVDHDPYGGYKNFGSADGIGTDASFDTPWTLAVDSSNNLYVADTANNTVRKITPLGSTNWLVTTIGGQVGVVGNTDGTGTNALFASPAGIAVDSANKIYVADTGVGLLVDRTYCNTIRQGCLAVVPPQPSINGIIYDQTNNAVTIFCSGGAGDTYWMQAATNLVSPIFWQTVSTNVADTNGLWQFTDSLTNVTFNYTAMRFYRAATAP